MDNLRQQMFSTETPSQETPPAPPRRLPLIGSLAPRQRLLLSVFLFMDVCVICFACLLAFRKISLPF
jgi:hypothetical protein